MKKLLIVIALVVVCVLKSTAQNDHKIEGYIIDSLSGGIELASVILLQKQDSVLVGFSITNKDGKFKIENLPAGNFLLNVSFLGYEDHYEELKIEQGFEDMDLGEIKLTINDELMDEVTISDLHVPIKIKKDTIEYNADAFNTQANDAVEELLKKLPGIEVDKDGTITAQGETVERILVEGKEFFGNDPTIATKNLPADAIDAVQVFDKLSDMAEFSGIDDGERSKTINLALKEDKKAGYFGNTTVGGGTDNRYEGKLNLNRFTSKTQLSSIGGWNNTNKQGFSSSDYRSFMGSLGSLMSGGRGNTGTSGGLSDGLVRTFSGGLNYNYDLGNKSDFSLSYFHNNIKNEIDREVYRENLLNKAGFTTDIESLQENTNRSHNISSRLKKNIDSTQNITLDFKLGWNGGNAAINSITNNFTATQLLQSAASQNNTSEGDKISMHSNLAYRKKLKKKGRIVTTGLSYGINNSDQNANLNSFNTFNRRDILEIDTIYQDQFQINDQTNYRLRFSYIEPLGGKKYLEFNASRRNFQNEYDKEFYDLFPNDPIGQIKNSELSNSYLRDYSYNQAGINFKLNRENMSLTTGLTFQQSDLDGTLVNNETEINQNYFNVLPSMNLQYSVSQASNLRMRYSTNVNEPSLEQLQPIVDNSNPLNIYVGNPDLNPEYRHNLRLNYNTFSQFSNTGFFTYLNFRYSKNKITNTRTVDEFLVQTTKPINVDWDWNIRGYVNYNTPVKAIKQRLSIGTNLSYSKSLLFVNELQNNTTRTSNGIRLTMTNLYSEKLNFNYGYNLRINTTKYSESKELNQTYLNHNYFLDFDYNFANDFSINTNGEHFIYSEETFGDQATLTNLNASISKVFLKSKKMRFELSVVDILNQNQNINRNSNLNYIQDERILSLGRYYLLSLSYSFSGFGGDSFNSGQGNRRGRRR